MNVPAAVGLRLADPTHRAGKPGWLIQVSRERVPGATVEVSRDAIRDPTNSLGVPVYIDPAACLPLLWCMVQCSGSGVAGGRERGCGCGVALLASLAIGWWCVQLVLKIEVVTPPARQRTFPL